MLNSVPREMLLLFKTNDCLRHAERQLNGKSVNSFIITLSFCFEALAMEVTERRKHVTGG